MLFLVFSASNLQKCIFKICFVTHKTVCLQTCNNYFPLQKASILRKPSREFSCRNMLFIISAEIFLKLCTHCCEYQTTPPFTQQRDIKSRQFSTKQCWRGSYRRRLSKAVEKGETGVDIEGTHCCAYCLAVERR